MNLIRHRLAQHLTATKNQTGLPLDGVDLKNLLENIGIDTEGLEQHLHFAEAQYQRIQLDERPSYQLWLLCWKKGQHSPVHDHGGAIGAVRILSGRAEENLYDLDPHNSARFAGRRFFEPGQVSVIEPQQVHSLGPAKDGPDELVTLHIYAPDLAEMRVFPVTEAQ